MSDVNTAFHLQPDKAEIKIAALTSRFVYISRQGSDILERVKAGEFLPMLVVPQDLPDRPRKFPHFLLTRYPVDVDHRIPEQYSGVYSTRRFLQDGSPINHIVVVWSLSQLPPSTITFDFLPFYPIVSPPRSTSTPSHHP